MPGRKPTNEEIDDRVDAVIGMLGKAWRMGDIKRGLRKLYGPISARTAGRYVARAREQILKNSNVSKNDWVADSLAVYLGIIRDPKTPASAKVQARARMDSVLGLDNAVVAGVSVKDAGAAYVESLMAAAQLDQEDVRRTMSVYAASSGSDEDENQGGCAAP
jgi:hypothetical protein